MAKVLLLRGAYANERREFGSACQSFQQAAKLSEGIGDATQAARARIALGLAYLHAGEPAAALASGLEGLNQATLAGDQTALMGAEHNLLLIAAELGSPVTALWLLAHNLRRYAAAASPLFWGRVKWTAARLMHRLGDPTAAAVAFDDVRREFLARDLPYDASLATLDLALVYLELGQHQQVRRLAEEMYSVFRAKQIPREASAALLLFAEAARREQCTAESISSLITDLKTRLAPAGRSLPAGKFVT